MKKIITTAILIHSFLIVNSQSVGIGSTTFTPGSMLSVAGGVSVGTYSTTAAPSNGLIVSGNVGIGTTSVTSKLTVLTSTNLDGIFSTDGTRWAKLMSGTVGAGSYNGIVQANDNAIIYSSGTVGNGAFVIAPWAAATSGIRMNGDGNVGINSSSPAAKLDLSGSSGTTLKIVDGNQGNGKVLTSDASGNARWQTPSSATSTGVGTYSLVAVANSTAASTVGYVSTGYTAQANKEYLVVAMSKSTGEFTTVTTSDAVSIFESRSDDGTGSTSGSSTLYAYFYRGSNSTGDGFSRGEEKTVVVLPSAQSAQYVGMAKFQGRAFNGSGSNKVQIGGSASCTQIYLDDAGVIFGYDNTSNIDMAMYVFER